MILKNKEFIIIIGVIPLVIFGIIVGWTDILKEDDDDIVFNKSDQIPVYGPLDLDGNPVYVPSDMTKDNSIFKIGLYGPLDLDGNPVYVPSDMTKDNSIFKIGRGGSMWDSTDVRKVKEHVVYTIQGTVLSIGVPIDWYGKNINKGYIPITISVEKIYKGNWKDDTFTFYISTLKLGDNYNFWSNAAQFEIDEKILIHLTSSTFDPFPDAHYYSTLGQYSKYQLQTYPGSIVDGVASTDDVILAFNIYNKNGIPLDSISGDALE